MHLHRGTWFMTLNDLLRRQVKEERKEKKDNKLDGIQTHNFTIKRHGLYYCWATTAALILDWLNHQSALTPFLTDSRTKWSEQVPGQERLGLIRIWRFLTWTMCSSIQSMMNQSKTWTRKNEIGSQRSRKLTAQAVKMPSSMHSDSGSSKMVCGHMAARSLIHLK